MGDTLTDFKDVLEYVGNTATAEEVRALFDAGNARIKHVRSLQAAETAAAVKVGDTVTTGGLKPAYLNGLTGTVKSVDRRARRTDVTIDLDESSVGKAGRYGWNGMLSGVPVSAITIL